MKSYTQLFAGVSIVSLGMLGSTQVQAAYLSQANLYSTIFDDPRNVTVGDWSVPTAELTRTAIANPATGITQTVSGQTYASAETGIMTISLASEVSLTPDAAISSSTSANIQSTNNRVIDDFLIGEGGGLINGDAAKIRLQVHLDGEYQLEGRPSDGFSYIFSLRAGNQVNLPEVAVFNTGGVWPPANEVFNQFWELTFDVIVGDTFRVDAVMSGWVNGTAFDRGESGLNYLNADSIFRVSNAPGYDLNIVSSAGALTSPIPLPAAFWLFGSGLIGLIGVARHKKI